MQPEFVVVEFDIEPHPERPYVAKKLAFPQMQGESWEPLAERVNERINELFMRGLPNAAERATWSLQGANNEEGTSYLGAVVVSEPESTDLLSMEERLFELADEKGALVMKVMGPDNHYLNMVISNVMLTSPQGEAWTLNTEDQLDGGWFSAATEMKMQLR